MFRKYYLKRMIALSFRGNGKSWLHCYYCLGAFYGYRWFFMSKRRKAAIVDSYFERLGDYDG